MKVGDRVISKSVSTFFDSFDKIGTIIYDDGDLFVVEFDENVGGHNGSGYGKMGHCLLIKKNNLILLDKSFVNTGHPSPGEKGEIKKPSSGICTLDYVSKFNPNSVSVFGFDWKATPTYYNQGGYNTSHDWKYEKEYCLEYFQNTLNFKFY
jgi:hypothetical protein